MLVTDDEHQLPNLELARCWSEAGAWRAIRRRYAHGLILGPSSWLEVRTARDAMLTHSEMMERDLHELLGIDQ